MQKKIMKTAKNITSKKHKSNHLTLSLKKLFNLTVPMMTHHSTNP